MEFKRSFGTNMTDSRCVYPKVHSWSLDGSGDCCSWDGIECDEGTGRVIALNLSSSCLSGTMSPNTTLFRLIHVESLNLAYNSFSFSPIPYGFSNLSRLQYLNLSHSDFSGEIPHDISQLSQLVSLDLSTAWDMTLHLPNMDDFVHNLTGLEELNLYFITFLLSLQLHGTTDLACSLPDHLQNPRRDSHNQNQRQGLPPPPQGLSRHARCHEDHPLLLPLARYPTPSINGRHSRFLSKISAWAEFVGYIGSVNLKIRDLRRLREDETCVE
ncbi:hypothetical protein NL676_018853 [Syzygium grande]|nr:hypothetical protein NL676_018853 [Syzygium grande]